MTDRQDTASQSHGTPGRGSSPVREPDAWRLTFEYDANSVNLVAQQRVMTLPPADDSDLTYSARAGWWLELRDVEGHGLYRQVLANPVRAHFEVHSHEPGATPSAVAVPANMRGAFQVLVPALADANDVVLYGLIKPGRGDELESRSQIAVPVVTAELGETGPYEES